MFRDAALGCDADVAAPPLPPLVATEAALIAGGGSIASDLSDDSLKSMAPVDRCKGVPERLLGRDFAARGLDAAFGPWPDRARRSGESRGARSRERGGISCPNGEAASSCMGFTDG